MRKKRYRATITSSSIPGRREPSAKLADGREFPMGWNMGKTFPVRTEGVEVEEPQDISFRYHVLCNNTPTLLCQPANELYNDRHAWAACRLFFPQSRATYHRLMKKGWQPYNDLD